MKLEAEVEGERHAVEIAGGEGHVDVVLDKETLSVDACAMEGFFYSLLVGGKGYEVTVEPDGEDFRVQVGIDAWRVRFLDPLRPADRESGAGRRGGRRTVTALMPGKVVRVLSRPGDEIEE